LCRQRIPPPVIPVLPGLPVLPPLPVPLDPPVPVVVVGLPVPLGMLGLPVLPELSVLPGMLGLPVLPGTLGLPVLPGMPELPGLPGLPVEPLPEPACAIRTPDRPPLSDPAGVGDVAIENASNNAPTIGSSWLEAAVSQKERKRDQSPRRATIRTIRSIGRRSVGTGPLRSWSTARAESLPCPWFDWTVS